MLTKEFKPYINDIVKWINKQAPEWNYYADFMKTIKKSFGKHSNSDKIEVVKWVERTKIRRNLDLVETFPELESWYKYCQNHR